MLDKKYQIPVDDGQLYYQENYFHPTQSDILYQYFLSNICWKTDKIKIFGKSFNIPRKQAYYADEGLQYSYSGKTLNPITWDKNLLGVKNKLEKDLNTEFNACLMNLYKDGEDSNGWHSDDEKELGKNPVIASISLGQERTFQIKHNISKLRKDLLLKSGSLLIMSGSFQHHWKHCLPKRKNINKARINLTFRKIIND